MPPWTIAHVIGTLGIGGAERQLVNYLLAADRARFHHVVYCLRSKGPLAELLCQQGIEVRVQRVRERTLWWDLPAFAANLRRDRTAVVHAHMYHAALFGRLAALLAGVPVRIVTEHGKELWKNRIQLGLDRLLSRVTCRHIAVSEDGLRIRLQRERVPPGRILLIPNGVTVPALPPDPSLRERALATLNLPADGRIIGTVGRFVAAKGYPILLEAFQQVRRQHPKALWLMIGDGPLRDQIDAMCSQAGLDDAVVRTGVRSDATELLAAIDVFVMPSLREGLPVALLEAMAAARPIVATEVGGMPDAIEHGKTGLLVPPADAGALAAAIASLLAAPDYAAALGRQAHATAAERYSVESVARRIEAVYDDCLAPHRRRSPLAAGSGS